MPSQFTWFCMGAVFGVVLCGWPWHPRFSRRVVPEPPEPPKQPLTADLIRYSRWRSRQIELALRDEPPDR